MSVHSQISTAPCDLGSQSHLTSSCQQITRYYISILKFELLSTLSLVAVDHIHPFNIGLNGSSYLRHSRRNKGQIITCQNRQEHYFLMQVRLLSYINLPASATRLSNAKPRCYFCLALAGAALTAAYESTRGSAKASRVYEAEQAQKPRTALGGQQLHPYRHPVGLLAGSAALNSGIVAFCFFGE